MYYISSVNHRLEEVVLPNTHIESIDVGGLNRKQLESVNQEQINYSMQKRVNIFNWKKLAKLILIRKWELSMNLLLSLIKFSTNKMEINGLAG